MTRRDDPCHPEKAAQLDTTGLRCPLPVIRTEAALRRLPEGSVLIVTADDPVARIDIPHFCREAGHHVQEIESEGETVVFRIERGPDAAD